MNELIKFLIKKLENHWHNFYSPLLLSAGFILIILASFNTSSILFLLLLCSGTTILIIITWLITDRIPKVPKGKIGIAISLTYDQESEAKQVEQDFICSLRNLLQRDADGSNIGLVVLPDFISNTLQDNTSINKVLRKCNAHLLLYGSVRRRNIQGTEMHLLNVEGIIRHAPIPKEISQKFADDFASSIPRKLMLTTESDALIFESASAWFDLSARYVIGVAAYLSGSVGYAERMLLHVENSLKNLKSAPPFLQSIAKKLPFRFKELYTNWQSAVYNAYILSGNIDFLKFDEQLNDKLLSRDSKNYTACIGKSIAEFVLRRNIQKAKEYLHRASNSKDATWMYNLAFLMCYEGDLSNSHEEYRKAFRRSTEDVTVPIQCEEFIQKILVEEPDKEQLYFALGLINYNAKKDYVAARNDLSAFLKSEWAGKFPNEKKLSEKLLHRCKSRLKY